LKVVQDVVLNHAGPVFFYDVDGDGVFDDQSKAEWVQPFKHEGYYANAVWADTAKWNLEKAQPDGPRELLGKKIATKGVLAELSSYGRKGFSPESLGKSDGEEIECDFFSLRDLWTKPGSAHFDRLVDEFVEIYAFYLLDVGVDGLRIDTVKHVHHEFWDAFTERLRKRLGAAAKDKLLFGEVYDGDPKKLGGYTWRSDAPKRKEPCLDSVLDFQTCFAARDYLRREGGEHGKADALERAMKALRGGQGDRPFYNPNPGPDGKNAREKSITFIENHDGLNRFRVGGVTAGRNDLAQALVMTLPGIPCLYYGAEVALHDTQGKVGQDTESGRLTLFRRETSPRLEELKETPSFQVISRAAELRKELPVLREGEFVPLWVDSPQSGEDDGVLAFIRQSNSERVMVVFNAAASQRAPKLPSGGFPAGTKLSVTPVCGASPVSQVTVGEDGRVKVSLGGNTALLLQQIVETAGPK
jgi:glycosidase